MAAVPESPYRGLPHQRAETVECSDTVDRLFASWCEECGLPTGVRTGRMDVGGRLATKRSVRGVFVPGAEEVRRRWFGSGPGYLPGYETVLVSGDILDALAAQHAGARDWFIEGPRGHWELSARPVRPMGCDGRPEVLTGPVLECALCRQRFRYPQELMAVAVSEEDVGGAKVFASGLTNRLQLFLDPTLYSQLGLAARRTDVAWVVPAEETFDLAEIVRPFSAIAAAR